MKMFARLPPQKFREFSRNFCEIQEHKSISISQKKIIVHFSDFLNYCDLVIHLVYQQQKTDAVTDYNLANF